MILITETVEANRAAFIAAASQHVTLLR